MSDTAMPITIAGLTVDRELHRFTEDELLPGSDVDAERFWPGLADLIARFTPRNRELLAVRADLQARIDAWHREHRDGAHDAAAYRSMLEEIGYLRTDPAETGTSQDLAVDPEIGEIAGPQLVVPVSNARYAINAANARWGSLYDALYGTDALGDLPPTGPYDPTRGARVVAWAAGFLDAAVPLHGASHAEVTGYAVRDGALSAATSAGVVPLADPTAFRGHLGDAARPDVVLLEHHGLGIQLLVDRDHPIGADHAAGLADVLLEAAVTVIMDLEDSVAAVDAADKVAAYRNWLGLMRGDLTAEIDKGGSTFVRRLEPDPVFTAPDGSPLRRRGRALQLVRNVGLLMTTPAVLDADGEEVFEGLLDTVFTVLAACHDLRRDPQDRNSVAGAVYVVKPKLHGPDEVTFTVEVFAAVEALLGLPAATIRLGLMDEERRSSVNLPACVAAAGPRLAFINTGFLDRTGDEMHTAMEAGAMVRKADMKTQPWLQAYEDRNVDVGLAAGLRGRAQIGKGMWAAPDRMRAMLDEKIAHPRAGANCAWVPSPTAATLHATHYQHVDVHVRQAELLDRPPASLDDLLTLPLADGQPWSAEDRQAEVDSNVQGILGYVVRWVDQGIGVSKVPDLSGTALMEDRATCRISSQHVANWLRHGVVTEDEVLASFRRMAAVVDEQNAADPHYRPMAPDFDGPAFAAAQDLVFRGREQPSGYTEPILHRRRQQAKRAGGGAS